MSRINAPKDLRGQQVREVARDDSVIITGAEYLRKSHAWDERNRLREVLRRLQPIVDVMVERHTLTGGTTAREIIAGALEGREPNV